MQKDVAELDRVLREPRWSQSSDEFRYAYEFCYIMIVVGDFVGNVNPEFAPL